MTTLLLVVVLLGLYLGLAVATGRMLRTRALPAPVRVPVGAQSMSRPRT